MEITELLKEVAQDQHISDLHLTVNSPPIVRQNGVLSPFLGGWGRPNQNDMERFCQELMQDHQLEAFRKDREIDFSFSMPNIARFRVNAYHQRDAIALAFRIIPSEIKGIEELGLPNILKEFCSRKAGFILCTGPTGSGKSTTLAAMVNLINKERQCHVLTLEDPIEYLHRHDKSIVHQREVGGDTYSFSRALRVALRQDPDVILVGEMRDLETISTALEAAETGHLVMATLHTNDAPQAVDRIIDVFPPHQQTQIRIQLAAVLEGVIAHQLLPRRDRKGRIPAIEILIANNAVRNLIREGKTHQLYSVMQTGAKHGMQTTDAALLKLYERGLITLDDAISRSHNPEYIQRRSSSL